MMTAAPRTVHHPAKLALDLGFRPIPLGNSGDPKAPNREDWQNPARIFHPHEWRQHEGVGLGCGLQPDGFYLNVLDKDHRPKRGIDAPFYYRKTLSHLPTDLAARLVTARSTSGQGRYIIFKSKKEILKGSLYNEQGRKIGDFLGVGSQVVMPTPERMLQGSLAIIPVLEDDEVDLLLSAAGYRRTETSSTLELDWTAVEHCLSNIDGILKRIKPHTLTYRQLHSDGGDDRSNLRWGVACELRRRFGYPDEEIAAILFHFNWGHLQDRGTKNLQADIERCIAGANDRYPDVLTSPSRCFRTKHAEPLPQVARPNKGGRPIRLSDEKYLADLQRDANSGAVMATQAERARKYKVSVPTIRRIEKRLQDQGVIERRTVRKGRQTYSYVVILSAIKTSAQPSVLVRSANDEIPHQDAAISPADVPMVEHASSECASPEVEAHDVAHVPLADAVRTVRAAGAKTRKQVHSMLRVYFTGHTWSEVAIDRHYDAQRESDRRQRTIARETAKIQAATPSELRRWARSYAWQHQEAHKRGNERQAYVFGCKEQMVNDEIERRRQAGLWTHERRRAPPADTPVWTGGASPPAPACSSPLPVAEEFPTVRIIQPWRYAAEARKRAVKGVCDE
jgi:DNA-binding Lrp family transcriptional regulator